jgi:hypothetical protein
MQIQPISWHYAKEKQCWIGKTNGLLSHVEMVVTPLHSAFQECLLEATIAGFKSHTVVGIDNAKTKAQEYLNTYAMSLIII